MSRPSSAKPTIVMSATQCFPELGGVEAHIEKVGAMVAKNDYDVRLVVTDRTGKLPKTEMHRDVEVRRFRAWPRARDYFFSPGFMLELLKGDYQLLHVQGIHTFTAPMAMIAGLLRRRPVVVTFHSGGSTTSRRERVRASQFRVLAPLLRRASCLIAVSKFEREYFSRATGIPTQDIKLIRNGGSLPPPNQPVTRVPGLILSVGRLERYKGHHRAISAMPALVREMPEARLRILGRGPYETDLRELVKTLEVEKYVEFGFVDPQNRAAMAAELATTSVVVLLSDYEAHPVAVMEALSLGTPAVVLRTSGLAELVDEGLALGIEPTATSQVIADALVKDLRAPRQVRISELSTWESCVSSLEQIYGQILAPPNH